jgi:hypothetical protein
MPDLHVHISRAQKEDWITWAMNVPPAASFWCSAVGSVGARERLVNSLAPPGSDTTDPAVIQNVYDLAAARLAKGQPADHYSSDKRRKRVLGYDVQAAENLEGAQVVVYSTNKVHFLWKHSGVTIKFDIPGSRSLIPKEKWEKRYLSFNLDGINVLNDMQEPLFRRDHQGSSVTWTKAELSRMEQGNQLQMLWQHHVPGEDWVEGAVEMSDTLPLAFYEPKGLGPLRQKQKKNLDKYGRPPNPGDGTWIVSEFLNDFYGDEGGRLFAGNPENFPEFNPQSVRIQLESFVQRSKYANYPWKTEWESFITENTRNATAHIRENVKFCREILNTKQERSKVGTKENPGATGVWWEIGPRRHGW